MFKILLISVLSIFFIGCGEKGEDKWTALIYPDKTNAKRLIENGPYKSLKECQEVATIILKEKSSLEKGKFNCGLNCEFNEGFKSYICEKLEENK